MTALSRQPWIKVDNCCRGALEIEFIMKIVQDENNDYRGVTDVMLYCNMQL